MASTGRFSQFLAITVTLAAANTAYNVVALIQAALNTNGRNDPSNAPTDCRNYQINFASDLNTGTPHVYLGDANVSATQRMFSMSPGASENRIDWRSVNLPLVLLYVFTDTAGSKIDIGVWQ